MILQEFKEDFLKDIRDNAEINQTTPEEEFISKVLTLLEELQEVNNPYENSIQKRGSRNKMMQFDAYGFDEADKSLSLILSDFQNDFDAPKLINTKIDILHGRMINFLEESYNGTLSNYFDDSDETIKIGNEIRRRLDILNATGTIDESIEKIKLFIITNAELDVRVKKIIKEDFKDRKVDVIIYSIERFHEIHISGSEREPIIINTSEYDLSDGIPCVLAEMTGDRDYDAYLAIVPGKFLSDIYYDHGSRLLEGNVRAFLSIRGNVNKGIRRTILQEPEKFFTYNNGIATTAKTVKIEHTNKGIFIKSIEDLQIINGGQTTASLTSAFIKDKNNLKDIFVPMKLTVVKNDNYDEMVSNIAKYANSQNKVTVADLFSNHRFHVIFENLSERIFAPATNNFVHPTIWFYERSRGKYEQKQFKLTTKSEKDKFKRKYPKNQVIKKEELAKYYNSINGKPHIVSMGAMKNMSDFAKSIGEIWSKSKENVNEFFFKKSICSAIIFRSTDSLIYKMPWYEKGGYKANIVTYTIAKLIDSIPKGYSLNYDKIWNDQNISNAFRKEIDILGRKTQDFILDSKGVIVTEYCKKEDTWKKYKEIEHKLNDDLINELIHNEEILNKERLSKKDRKLDTQVSDEIEVVNLGSDFWIKMINEADKYEEFTYHDRQMLKVAANLERKIPTPKQAKEIMKIKRRLEELGVVVV